MTNVTLGTAMFAGTDAPAYRIGRARMSMLRTWLADLVRAKLKSFITI